MLRCGSLLSLSVVCDGEGNAARADGRSGATSNRDRAASPLPRVRQQRSPRPPVRHMRYMLHPPQAAREHRPRHGGGWDELYMYAPCTTRELTGGADGRSRRATSTRATDTSAATTESAAPTEADRQHFRACRDGEDTYVDAASGACAPTSPSYLPSTPPVSTPLCPNTAGELFRSPVSKLRRVEMTLNPGSWLPLVAAVGSGPLPAWSTAP